MPGPGLLRHCAIWLHASAAAAGVHAGTAVGLSLGTCAGAERFHPLDPVNLQIHQRLKQAFDPRGLINPGRMYTGL